MVKVPEAQDWDMGIVTAILLALLMLFLLDVIPAGRQSRRAGLGLGGIAAGIAVLLLILWLA